MSPSQFVDAVSAIELPLTFNPYRHNCKVHDVEHAADYRRQLLLDILDAASGADVDAIWVGRDLGHRGGRRTGLALTDDVHVAAHAARWGILARRATRGEAVAERTASIVWSLLGKIEAPIFLWNVFPLHPYGMEGPFTNRSHTAAERKVGEQLLRLLIDILRPKRVIAIGNDAFAATQRIAPEIELLRARHPSYGGQREFEAQIELAYGVTPDKQLELL